MPELRDIVVIGASSGGMAALPELARNLPAEFPAAVCVAMHLAPWYSSQLPELLNEQGGMRARFAVHGEPLQPGTIYIAPPDNHLLVRNGFVHVQRGPKENGHRPSVDVLFRSASRAYGPRVIGAVLTGALDCGTAGLLSIKARGGMAIAQLPSDAEVPAMPESAIRHTQVDHVVALRDLGALLARLVREVAPTWPERFPQGVCDMEGDQPGTASELVCPACNGKMQRADVSGFDVYRCHEGHAFSEATLALQQDEEVERSLWAAARALDESAAHAGRMANKSVGELKQRLIEREQTAKSNAQAIRRLVLAVPLRA